MNIRRNRRIAITGVGPLTSIGVGKKELWKSILQKRQGVSYEKFYLGKDYLGSAHIYKIKNLDIGKFGINKKILNEINVWRKGKKSSDLNFFLATIKLALDDSEYDVGNGSKTGVILTHEQPDGEQFFSDLIDKSFDFIKQKGDLSKKEYFELLNNTFSRDVYNQQTFMPLFQVAKVFGVHGYSLFINNACASGLYAMEIACQLIRSNLLNTVIVSAVDNSGLLRSIWMRENNLYSSDGRIRPFSLDRNGFVCGQGGAALILEDLEYAKRRGAYIYAEYVGGRFVLESWKVAFPNILENYYVGIIKEVLKENHILPKNIDLINAHGVATNLIDQYEAKAIRQVFGKTNCNVMVNALKPYIGHTLGASGLLEIAILLIGMKKGALVPTLNVDPIDTKLKLNVVTKLKKAHLKTILKLSCGFGGFDGAVILKKT
ncbi:MAG: hypothetical protein KAS66_14495 [Candidatus Omnitrophica bacterium]|nr:hypothetical protein [Candidatus Omnitrophota bacterium]